MTTTATLPRQSPGRPLLLLGLFVPFMGVAGYAAQLAVYHLTAPWYLPIATTLGVVLVAASLWQALSVWRVLALLLTLLLCAVSWLFLIVGRLPVYDGPLAEGKPFPTFTTARADGSPFTERDLAGDGDTVMVFFRGRW